MRKVYYLVDKDLKRGWPCVARVEDNPIPNYELVMAHQGVREYISEDGNIPERLIFKNGVIVEPTEQEKYDLDGYLKNDDKFFVIKAGEQTNNEQGNITTLSKDTVYPYPDKPQNILKPVFDKITRTYNESASTIEITAYQNGLKQSSYNEELRMFEKANTELSLGVLDQVAYNEYKEYMIELANYTYHDIAMTKVKPAFTSRYGA